MNTRMMFGAIAEDLQSTTVKKCTKYYKVTPRPPLSSNGFEGASNLGKHKFFFWLLLRDRLNTKNLLRRKTNILEDYNCVFL
jgi:hypothetical protein